MGLIDLDRSSSIALDTNIFILALDHPGAKGELARLFLEHLKEVTPRIFISTLVLEEFFVKVYKVGRQNSINELINFINMGGLVITVDMNSKIALSAAKIRAKYPSVKAPDAIHLATAIESKAKIFVSTDKRLPKKIEKLSIEILS